MGAPAAGDRDPAEAAEAATVVAALLAACERIACAGRVPPVSGATPGELRAALEAARRQDREAGT